MRYSLDKITGYLTAEPNFLLHKYSRMPVLVSFMGRGLVGRDISTAISAETKFPKY